jgi:hypothetical protein
MHFYGWSKGLKTGLDYLRTRPKVKTIAFTVDQETAKDVQKAKEDAILACSRENPEGCLMCSA